MAKKAMLGHKVRRLRRDVGLTQAQMAERLGISPSYLNLIENNQRSVTVDLLLRIGQTFDLDLASFAEDDGAQLLGGLQEAFGDPLFETAGGTDVKRTDLVDLSSSQPAVAQAVIQLHRAYRQAREDLRLMAEKWAGREGMAEFDARAPAGGAAFALEEVRDHFQDRGNYFPDLEAAAEEVWQVGALELGALGRGLTDYLDRELTLRVKVMPIEVMGPTRRRYDRHGRRILLSEMLTVPSRTFQLAAQIGLIKYRGLLDRLVADASLSSPEAGKLARIGLANYLAAAIVMPYDRFYRAATSVRYDIEILQHRFEAGFEQVCHRLTTLQRPGAKGVPFFLIRSDKAGNISKRFSSGRLSFARLGGACPRWNLHDAFRSPGRLQVQVAELPDGTRLLGLSRTVTKPGAGFRLPGQSYAVALGCEISHAAQIVYADGVDLASDDVAVPIGLHCRLCERLDCGQRAFPPLQHKLAVDENVRGATAYSFEPQ